MPAREIDYQIQTDGRIHLEDLPVAKGQTVRILLPEAQAEPAPERPRDSPHAGLLRGTLKWYHDPCEPAADPRDWEAESA